MKTKYTRRFFRQKDTIREDRPYSYTKFRSNKCIIIYRL